LGVELKHLKELNQQLSEDAKNLTRALRGSAKAQGTWGEWIREKVLEGSGLRRDHEYVVQTSHSREDGTRALPDVIIHLPEGRSLVTGNQTACLPTPPYSDGRSAISVGLAIRSGTDS
jgi:DNA recombination protein RmuC